MVGEGVSGWEWFLGWWRGFGNGNGKEGCGGKGRGFVVDKGWCGVTGKGGCDGKGFVVVWMHMAWGGEVVGWVWCLW